MSILADRVGLIGDVHAEDRLLEGVLAELAAAGVETILCTGDIADGPGSVDRACALLAEHHVIAVRGNHDRWVLGDTVRNLPDAVRLSALAPRTIAYLNGLPRTYAFSSELGGVMLCHGLGKSDMSSVSADDTGYALESNFDLQSLIADPDLQIVINGHTHSAMLRHFPGVTVVNAGTIFHRHDPCYVVADFSSGEVTRHGLSGARETRVLGSLRAVPT